MSLEELQARRAQGTVKAETFIIEHTGQSMESLAWKRYQDVFPAAPSFPPLPSLTPPPVPAPAAPPPAQPHPLFPSAAPIAGSGPVFPPGARPGPYYKVKPTNSACAWGFGLGLAGFIFSMACGLGLFLALPSLLFCVVGLAQLSKNKEQEGKGLAIAGLVLSSIALVVSLILIISIAIPILKSHSSLTVTEQTSNDSE